MRPREVHQRDRVACLHLGDERTDCDVDRAACEKGRGQLLALHRHQDDNVDRRRRERDQGRAAPSEVVNPLGLKFELRDQTHSHHLESADHRSSVSLCATVPLSEATLTVLMATALSLGVATGPDRQRDDRQQHRRELEAAGGRTL